MMKRKYICCTQCPTLDKDNTMHCRTTDDNVTFCPLGHIPKWQEIKETKEMVYSAVRLNPPERLAEGDYKGFTYYVLNLGTHPCAYIDVTDTNLNGVNYNDIEINCHFGLTYSGRFLNTVEKEGWFIGWDYAHYCDFAGYELVMPAHIRTNGKKWTTDEIVNECKEVIDQLVTHHPLEKGNAKLLQEGQNG